MYPLTSPSRAPPCAAGSHRRHPSPPPPRPDTPTQPNPINRTREEVQHETKTKPARAIHPSAQPSPGASQRQRFQPLQHQQPRRIDERKQNANTERGGEGKGEGVSYLSIERTGGQKSQICRGLTFLVGINSVLGCRRNKTEKKAAAVYWGR